MKIMPDDRTHQIEKIRTFPDRKKIANWSDPKIAARVFLISNRLCPEDDFAYPFPV
jgi:hypothetical protein